MTETLHIAALDFEVRRSPRRKTIGLTVDRAGELVVHAPESAGEDQIRQWVSRKLLWVHRKLAQKQDLRPLRRSPEFVTGESIFYLGRSYRLRIEDSQAVPLDFDGEWFRLRRKNQAEAALHFRAWFIRTGADWLAAKVKDLLPRFGGGDVTVRVGDLGYRWGSYSKKGVMHFNWRLLQLPVRLIDYVIAHELVHRFEYNHGPQFWERLECSMPDCLARKAELKREWHCYATFDVDEQKTTVGARLDGTKCSPCPKA